MNAFDMMELIEIFRREVAADREARLVRGHCFTNLDEFSRAEWPKQFYRVPEIGERVEGRQGDMRPWLKVVGITHTTDREGKPFVSIELHR